MIYLIKFILIFSKEKIVLTKNCLNDLNSWIEIFYNYLILLLKILMLMNIYL